MRRAALALAAVCAVLPAKTEGQTPQTGSAAIDVFLDCQTRGCDSQHFRTEIAFVNWVRDRTVADVHLLITAQSAGAGGTEYQLAFIGGRGFAGDTVTTAFSVGQTDTDAEQRDLLTNRIAQGLLYFARGTAAADRIRVVYSQPRTDAGAVATAVDDPWNFWVFSTSLNGSMNGESREQSREFRASGSADRVTAGWKLEFDVNGSYDERKVELSGDRTVTRLTKDYEAEGLVARSVADLWSAGFTTEVGKSTFQNQDLYARTAALLEYSFLPYSEYSRRRVLLRYTLGVRHFNYEEETIYDRLEETRADHQLQLSTNFQQPWGSARLSLSGAHYLHDVQRYNVSAFGGLDVRLFRGFTLDVSGNASRVHDQLYIPKGDADDEEVLLRRRALETNYRYRTSIGIRYTFGSVYNNIVNPRLNQGGGGPGGFGGR